MHHRGMRMFQQKKCVSTKIDESVPKKIEQKIIFVAFIDRKKRYECTWLLVMPISHPYRFRNGSRIDNPQTLWLLFIFVSKKS